jgi:uncharacterized protein YgiM (DUF1202 family)
MTTVTLSKKIALGLAMTATALTMTVATAPAANAMSQKLGGVVGCDASGGKQEVGAVIGGLLGAVAGAGAGSFVGCQMQKKRAADNAGGAYTSDGIRLSQSVEAAPMTKIKGKYVARSTLNLRASASPRGARVGSVQAGETFQALGRTGDGKWILVGQDGVGVGYVSSAYVYRA